MTRIQGRLAARGLDPPSLLAAGQQSHVLLNLAGFCGGRRRSLHPERLFFMTVSICKPPTEMAAPPAAQLCSGMGSCVLVPLSGQHQAKHAVLVFCPRANTNSVYFQKCKGVKLFTLSGKSQRQLKSSEDLNSEHVPNRWRKFRHIFILCKYCDCQ